jgi:hypothetical protein
MSGLKIWRSNHRNACIVQGFSNLTAKNYVKFLKARRRADREFEVWLKRPIETNKNVIFIGCSESLGMDGLYELYGMKRPSPTFKKVKINSTP